MKFAPATTIFLTSFLFPVAATAQVTPDGTTSTTVTPTATGVQIDEGDRAGGNLFHSFGEFSIPTGSEAYFNNASDISNIFSRVTGGNISNIDGLLRANGTANLFLINPAGIVFGEGARLQLGGSFYGSTADSIVFSNGEFSATDLENPPLITINAPIGLGFRDEPQSITNRSFVKNDAGDFIGLEVVPGATLTLVGGDIDFQGGEAKASGGRIELGGLAEAGTVTFNEDGSLSFPEDVAKANLTFSNLADLDVRGIDGGSITLNGNNISFAEESTIKAGITADSTSTEAQAGDININATGAINLSGTSGIQNIVETDATGNSGNISVTAQSLTITEGSYFNTSTFGQGNPGNVTIDVTEAVTLSNNGDIFSTVGDTATVAEDFTNSNVNIKASSFTIADGDSSINLFTFGNGNAGNITLDIQDEANITSGKIFSNVASGATGNGGEVTIQAGSLSLLDGGQIQASVLGEDLEQELAGGKGNAGNVVIDVEGNVVLSGVDEAGFASTIFSDTETGTVGNAGNISVTAQNLNLTDGGKINSNTSGTGNPGNITIDVTKAVNLSNNGDILSKVETDAIVEEDFTNSNVSIKAGSFTISDLASSITTDTNGQGNAGNVTIDVDGRVEIFAGSIFSDVNEGAVGNAGNISVTAQNLNLTDGGYISSSTFGNGNGGTVNIETTEDVNIKGFTVFDEQTTYYSSIFSEVKEDAEGNAGNVSVTAGSLTLSEGGKISSSTFGQGNPGNITIDVTEAVNLSDDGNIFTTVEDTATVAEDFTNSEIKINAGSLKIADSESVISSVTAGKGNAGNINLEVDGLVEIIGNGIFSDVNEGAEGNAGNVSVTAQNINLTDGGQISSSTFGAGDAGQVNLEVENNLEINNGTIFNNVERGAAGDGGEVTINAGSLSLLDGGQIQTIVGEKDGNLAAGKGDAGNVVIDVDGDVLISGINQKGFPSKVVSDTETGTVGNAGNVSITAQNLTLSDGGAINASTSGQGDAGKVTITASDTISATGDNSQGFSSGIFSTVDETGKGNAKGIEINTANLTLTDGGRVNASTFGQGNAGKVTITATDAIFVEGDSSKDFSSSTDFSSGIYSGVTESGVGNAGGVELTTENLTITNNGAIGTRIFGQGNGGDVTIKTGSLFMNNGSEISASNTGTGNSGSVSVTANTAVCISV